MEEDQVGWLRDLGDNDAALVRAFRNAAIVLGHGSAEHRDAARVELDRLAPAPERGAVVRSFWALMSTIGRGARRQIRYHAPQCPCLGLDEVTFLWIFEHLRNDRRAQAITCASMLVADEAAERMVHHADSVARCSTQPRGTATSVRPGRLTMAARPGHARLH